MAEEPHAGASRVVELGDIKLRGTGTVTGTVLGDGKPLAGVQVSLIFQIDRDGRTELESGTDRVETDSAGRFRFETVEAGRRVSAYANVDGFTSQGTMSHALASGQELEIPPIDLKSRSAFVAGIVVDPNGKPVAGATVARWSEAAEAYPSDAAVRPSQRDLTGGFASMNCQMFRCSCLPTFKIRTTERVAEFTSRHASTPSRAKRTFGLFSIPNCSGRCHKNLEH